MNARARRSGRRGQALVEAALGMLVFVTVLLFGIHFAEVGFLSLKVEEAANSALFDTTAYKMHDTFSKDFGIYRTAVNAASANQTQRYQDWDGRASKQGGASNLTQVVTRGTPLNVTCGEARGQLPSFGGGPLARAAFSPPYPGGAIGDSVMSCTASTTLRPFKIPRRFLENEPFQAQHLQNAGDITICAGSRSKNGNCGGSYGILLDDWGFSGQAEARECPLAPEGGSTCANQGYYNMVNAIYSANGGGQGNAGSALATLVVGSSPINEGKFYMSFHGLESQYKQTLPASHQTLTWKVSPFDVEGYYRNRQNCWLGHGC